MNYENNKYGYCMNIEIVNNNNKQQNVNKIKIKTKYDKRHDAPYEGGLSNY